MKIKIILNNSEQDAILKKYFLKTLPPSMSEEDVEIDYDSSHEPSFSIDDFENKQNSIIGHITKPLPYFCVYAVGPNNVMTNCTDMWNGTKAFGYEPRYALLKGERYSVYYRDARGEEHCLYIGQTFQEAENFVKNAGYRLNS